MKLLAALTVLLIAVASCGPLPRPFQPEDKRIGDNALLLLPDGGGITLVPVSGAVSQDYGRALAEAVAEALHDENVPAMVGDANRSSRWLLGRVERAGRSGDGERLRLTWELYDSDGSLLDSYDQETAVSSRAWRTEGPQPLDAIARDAAPRIAAFIQGPEALESELPGYPPETRISVAKGAGEPRDGAEILTAVLTRRLRDAGLPVAEEPRSGDVIIEGTLALGPPMGEARAVEVVWIVRRQGEDEPIGDLKQNNPVPIARVENEWPRLARLIVEAATPDLLRVVEAGAPKQ